MSGLMLAGIGKGISDAGQTFGNAMLKDYELTRQEALATLREERLGKREEAREIRAEDRKEAAALKDAGIYAKAEESAIGVGETRRFDKFKKDLGQTDMPEEDLRKVFDQQYDQRKVGAFEGSDRYVERYSQQKEDVLNEIRRGGGSSGLIAQAQASYKTAKETERASDRLAFDERKAEAQEDRRSREFAALMPVKQQTADAATARAARPVGGDGVAKVRSTYTDDQGMKIAVMSDGSTKELGRGMDFDKQVSSLVTTMSKNDYTFSQLPEDEKRAKAIERLTGPAKAPSSSDNQSPPKYKSGESKVIQAGPNKGKTAVFDGTGWTLK